MGEYYSKNKWEQIKYLLVSTIFVIPIILAGILAICNQYTLQKVCRMKQTKISNQKELNLARTKWCGELKLNPDIIECKFETNELSNLYKTARFHNGAFCDFNSYKNYKYLVVISPIYEGKSNTEMALIHELLHIEKGHLEKQKNRCILRLVYDIIYELEVNNQLLKIMAVSKK